MKKLLLISALFSISTTYANFGSQIASGPHTMGIGNQADLFSNSTDSHFYHPALATKNEKTNLSLSASSTSFSFEEITNIVTQNDTNSQTGEKVENLVHEYENISMGQLHGVIPFSIKDRTYFIGLSLFSPLLYIAKFDSGSPELPEYVMYKSKIRRLDGLASFSSRFNNFSFSLGSRFGFELEADLEANASLNGTSFGSSARAKASVTPKVGAVASAAYEYQSHAIALTASQGMSMEATATVTGQTTDPRIIFDLTSDSLAYYEPDQVTASYGWQSPEKMFSIFASTTYQVWDGFKPPTIRLTQEASVLSSNNYEEIKTKNTQTYNLGGVFSIGNYKLMGGLSTYETPLDSDFSGAGNTIDSDSTAYHFGLAHKLGDVTLTLSYQLKRLKELSVVKTDGQENGNPGSKIGAPGFTVGGEISNINLGLSVDF